MCKPLKCHSVHFSSLQTLKLLKAPTIGCKTTDQAYKAIQRTGWICAKNTAAWAGPHTFVEEIWNYIVNSGATENQVVQKKKCVDFFPSFTKTWSGTQLFLQVQTWLSLMDA